MLNEATLTPIYEEEPVESVEPEEAPKTNYRSPAYEYDEDYQYEAEIEENKEAPEDERIRKKPVKKQKSNKKVASNDKKENQVAETSVNPTGDQEVKKYHINQISDEEERARLEAESNRLAEDRKRLEALDFKITNLLSLTSQDMGRQTSPASPDFQNSSKNISHRFRLIKV